MGLRPQTLYGIADSPVGLAGYLMDHDARSYALIAGAFAGKPSGISRDDFLDNITQCEFTNHVRSRATRGPSALMRTAGWEVRSVRMTDPFPSRISH